MSIIQLFIIKDNVINIIEVEVGYMYVYLKLLYFVTLNVIYK